MSEPEEVEVEKVEDADEPSTDLVARPDAPGPSGHLAELDLTWRLCQRICQRGNELVPKTYWGRPEAALAAILMGRELGLGDMVALQRIYVVDGKVVLAAELIRGLVRRAGHSLAYGERTALRCEITGTRADNGDTLTVAWTIEDAKGAGLATKTNWKTYPRAMLDARATTELARALFSDAIGWAVYAPEDFTEVAGS